MAEFSKNNGTNADPDYLFVSIMLTISCFKVFDLIYTMTEGGPGRSTNVLVMHIYQSAFTEYKFGYASAVAWYFL